MKAAAWGSLFSLLGGLPGMEGYAGVASARVLLVPNGGSLPGELGWLLGGAQVALASSGEALWYNPAGLAGETGTRVTVSGDAMRLRTATIAGDSEDSVELAPGSLAYAHALGALGDRRSSPRFVVGLGLVQGDDQRWNLPFSDQRTAGAEALPPGADIGGNVDATYPGGVRIEETGSGEARLQGVGLALGLGMQPATWLRLGAAARLERIALEQRLVLSSEYGASDGGDTLTGQSQLAWDMAGEALRLAWAIGAQLEVASGIVLGLALALPSETLNGSGRVHYQRSDAFTVNSGQTDHETIVVARDGLPFQLDSPQRLQLGLAFRSDRILVELDVYRLSEQTAYTVLEGGDSEPPSSQAFALPALTTSGASVVGYALGLAFSQTERTTLLIGFASQPSPVPSDDPLFRSVDFLAVSAGAYHVRGDLSGSLGVVWREARAPGLAFASPDGREATVADTTVREVAARMGASISF